MFKGWTNSTTTRGKLGSHLVVSTMFLYHLPQRRDNFLPKVQSVRSVFKVAAWSPDSFSALSSLKPLGLVNFVSLDLVAVLRAFVAADAAWFRYQSHVFRTDFIAGSGGVCAASAAGVIARFCHCVWRISSLYNCVLWSLALCVVQQLRSAKPHCSIYSLAMLADTAFWLCTTEPLLHLLSLPWLASATPLCRLILRWHHVGSMSADGGPTLPRRLLLAELLQERLN